jgi:formate hydrogenlyase subunit 6/NADH:ubiquinone oxidoreductase subunit I
VSAERLTTVQYPEQRIAPIEATRDFPFLVYDGGTDWEAGMRCVACQICEKGVPAEVHLYREEHGQEAGLRGQAAVLSGALRYRYLGVHELPDLRGGLPV